MNKLAFSLLCCLFLLNSCAPKVSTYISKSYAVLDYKEDVKVFGLEDPAPANAELLGTVKIGDTGFSVDCDLQIALDKAKTEARKIGGNAIKITQHIPPSFMGSSCHRITANILRVENFDEAIIPSVADSLLFDADYALLHIYRGSGAGTLVGYDLHLGNEVICRVKNKWKETIKIEKEGLNTLWASTEAKVELPIKIQFGHEYYIRCSIVMGIMVGRPKLELIDNQIGKFEYESIKDKKTNKK